MGTITTGIGLISGIDIATLIDSIITIESAGKFRLQQRLAEVQTQQAALLDINARLLAFKSASGTFKNNDIFQSSLATSSDDEILTATASTAAQPGTYKFIVRQLVSTSQQLTRGFATANVTPLGLDDISFEFGNGRLTLDRDLEELNGGTGVDRGRIIITDRTGTSATIDLTDVTTVQEVLDRVNGESTIDVTLTIVDDHFVLTDNTGDTTSNLIVTSALGDTTAADLGIADDVAAAIITGTAIMSLAGTTALSTLNDGNGVLVRNNNLTDFVITASNGDIFNIDLGRIDFDMTDATLLADLNNGTGVTINGDSEPDLQIVDRDGEAYDIDLTGVTTIGQLRTQVSSATSGRITITVDATGDKLIVTDTVGGTGLLKVNGAGPNGTATANDLGILEETGVSADTIIGSIIPNSIEKPEAQTVQDVLDRINTALDTLGAANAGRIVATIGTNGLVIDDTTGGAGSLVIATTATNPTAAIDLGIETAGSGPTLTGSRIIGALGSVLTRSINGGSGLNGATTITVTDRDGLFYNVGNLDTFATLDEIITEMNTQAGIAGVQVTVALNQTGNGLTVTDTSGGSTNLIITGDGATALGIVANVAENTVEGTNLQLQYVSRAARLTDLNYGRGIGKGSFKITDSVGGTATVTIGGDELTLHDIILEINSKGLKINARVNDNGDGLLIEENVGGETPFVKMKIVSVSGTTATDLNIIGEAANVVGGFIDGSYERRVDLDVSDSINDVVSKINAAGIPISATLINTGSGSTPFRLNVTSGITGSAGDLVIDSFGVDLGLSTLARGADTKVFFGSDNPEDALLLRNSDNSLDDVIPGVTIDLLKVSTTPVTVTITRDVEAIVGAVSQFVTAFNEVVGRIDEFTFFDVETEERGILLSNSTAAQIRSSLFRVATGSALNLTGSFRFLTQVGIGFDGEGQMTIDDARLREAYDQDPEGVEDLFAAFESTTGGTTEIAEGVTIDNTTTTFSTLGFGNLFDNLLDDLTNSIDGLLTSANDAFDSQIDLLKARVATIDERLLARRDQLNREFTAMESILARLQAQSGTLASLAANVTLAGTRLTGTNS